MRRQINAVVKPPNSYYVFTTIDGFNLPHFAPFCSFCDFFNNFLRKNKPRKSRQNTANQRISGGIFIMIKILFVCHGNICRNPMVEFVMKDLSEKAGLYADFHIKSAATSNKDIGLPVYPPARRKLAEHSIDCSGNNGKRKNSGCLN